MFKILEKSTANKNNFEITPLHKKKGPLSKILVSTQLNHFAMKVRKHVSNFQFQISNRI